MQPVATLESPEIRGLSEADAATRRDTDRPKDREQEKKAVRRAIWRTNLVSVFNVSLLGLALLRLLLEDPLGALAAVGVAILNVVLKVAQEFYATGKVEALIDLARPWGTVVRDGRLRSIAMDEIVLDDVLVVGPGDQFLADGAFLRCTDLRVQTLSFSGESRTAYPVAGDTIQAGSFCAHGRGTYQVSALSKNLGARQWRPVPKSREELTPLQRIIDRFLRIMLLFVVIFVSLIIAAVLGARIMLPILQGIYRDALTIVFSIVPSGLFFAIIATYALGSARLGRAGAFVRESRSLELLAQLSVLCFGKTGTLTGARIDLEMIPWVDGRPALSENRVRQVLGDLAHSVRSGNVYIHALVESLEGSKREFDQQAPFLPIYGWAAVTLQEVDLRGTYVIGRFEIVESHLAHNSALPETVEEDEQEEGFVPSVPQHFKSIGQADPDENPIALPVEASSLREGQLLFAYAPDPEPLYDADGQPRLPEGLIPLCTVTLEPQMRPEAMEAIRAFADAGVKIKILSSDSADRVLAAARQLGLENEAESSEVVSGFLLAQLDEGQIKQIAQETTFFANLTTEQKGQIVDVLRQQGERVAMVGDTVRDISAMQKANLSITFRNSSQASLSVADMVLLEDSFDVLPTVLQYGQRIVNGLVDILKLSLTHIIYILLLLAVAYISGRRFFYYDPAQGTEIALFTLTIPSLGLSFWASAGALPAQYVRLRIVYFVAPAVVTIVAAVLATDYIFSQTGHRTAEVQLAVTYGLIGIGLLLVLFAQPPSKAWVAGDVLNGDKRTVYLVVALFLIFNVLSWTRISRYLFQTDPLGTVWEYVIVGIIVLLWAIFIRAVWRSRWLNRILSKMSEQVEEIGQ